MRYKVIEKIPVRKASEELMEKQGMAIAAQLKEGYLILDIWDDLKHVYRYAMDVETHEYAMKKTVTGIWHNQKICNIKGNGSYWGRYGWDECVNISKKDMKCITDLLQKKTYITGLRAIDRAEEMYCKQKREQAYNSKVKRIDRLMQQVPPVPKEFPGWIVSILDGNIHYAFWNKEEKTYNCTSCGNTTDMIKLDTGKDKKIRNRDMVECPLCHAKLQVKKRCNAVEKESMAMVLSPVSETMSVARHFNIRIRWEKQRLVSWDEAVRIFLYRNDPEWSCRIYYRQYPKHFSTIYTGLREQWWDTNPANRRIGNEFLYPADIMKCLKDTSYQEHTRFFMAAASEGYQARYNDIMYKLQGCGGQLEYLYKCRYYRLLKELTDNGWCYNSVIRHAADIGQITGIEDRQILHRLRDKNGGITIMEWLAHVGKTKERISDKALDFFDVHKIRPRECIQQTSNMSPDQIMNYLLRQQKEQYSGLSYPRVLEQWNDYLAICRTLNKDINDPMVYRPKELKRRHDEAVEETNRQRIIENMNRNPEEKRKQAQEMREKYPGAEEILKEIKEKYEYRTEEFLVLVPKNLLDIATEGQALHHCVASTDRYFDRIKERETYVLFLRKAEDPDVPYYTLEVEPNGTIRQHRSYFDEEPNIEYIRGFLKEWQQVVRKRMTKKDHEYAEYSKRLREKNIEELKENKNTRVLKGLEQDFLEAV